MRSAGAALGLVHEAALERCSMMAFCFSEMGM